MNKKGVTLVEALVAVVLMCIFIAAFYRVFLFGRKVSRETETSSTVHSVGLSVLEQLYRYQGTGKRGDTSGVSSTFNSAEDAGSLFEPGVEHDISVLHGTEGYNLNEQDYILKKSLREGGDIAPSSMKYQVTDYTGNTYCPAEGPGQRDGFRKVQVKITWEDKGKEQLKI